MDFGKRLKEARLRNKLTQEALAKIVNTKKTTISNYETGYSTPSNEMLVDISDALEVTTDWLLGKNNISFEQANQHYLNAKSIRDIFSQKEHIVKESKAPFGVSEVFVDIPILGNIRAGQPIERIEHYEGTYPVLKRTINGYDAFWLRVKGESMSGDEIHDGDLVCIIVTTDVNSSDIAAVAINGDEATLKRVKQQGDMCMLIPSNPTMEPSLVPAKDVHIIGKVVGFQRYFK